MKSFQSHLYIKSIWKTFEKLKIEKQRLFYLEETQLSYIDITANSNEYSGSVDEQLLLRCQSDLYKKKVIAVHNHPKQKPYPSNNDYFQKKHLEAMLSLLGVELVDYVIVSPYGYFSFQENDVFSPFFYINTSDSNIELVKGVPKIMTLDDIKHYESDFRKLFAAYNEMIYTPEKVYVGCVQIDASFLLGKQAKLSERNIFFKVKESENDLHRLEAINRVIEPFEIYWITKETFFPLKANGIL
jgi:hypothetical protein